MAFNLAAFIRDLSFETLDAYAESKGVSATPRFAEARTRNDFVHAATSFLDALDPKSQAAWRADFEQADELQRGAEGERSLNLVVRDWLDGMRAFEAARSGNDRALWLLALHPDRFRRLQEIRFFERGIENESIWSVFDVVGDPRMDDFETRVHGVFCDRLDALLDKRDGGGRRPTRAEIWKRPISRAKQEQDRGGRQIFIRRGRLPQTQAQVQGEDIVETEVRLTSEIGLIYDHDRRLLDVVVESGGGKARQEIAYCFCEHVLNVDVVSAPPRQQRFELDRLARRHEFGRVSDSGVSSVRVAWLRLMWPGEASPILDVRPRDKATDIWISAGTRLKGASDVGIDGAIVLQAKLDVVFASRPNQPKHTRSIRLDRSGASSLRRLSEDDRAVLEPLIDEWGLRTRTVRGAPSVAAALGVLFESGACNLSIDELRTTIGDFVNHAAVQSCLTRARPADSVPCPTCQEPHLIHDRDTPSELGFWIFCPVDGWRDVETRARDRVSFDQATFLAKISKALQLDPRRCSDLVPGHVWLLGDVENDGRNWRAFVGRGLNSPEARDWVEKHFLARPLGSAALCFCAHPSPLPAITKQHLAFGCIDDVFQETLHGDLEANWTTVARLMTQKAPRKGKSGRKNRATDVWATHDKLSEDVRATLKGKALAERVRAEMTDPISIGRIQQHLRKPRPET